MPLHNATANLAGLSFKPMNSLWSLVLTVHKRVNLFFYSYLNDFLFHKNIVVVAVVVLVDVIYVFAAVAVVAFVAAVGAFVVDVVTDAAVVAITAVVAVAPAVAVVVPRKSFFSDPD